ncbi:MAG: flagellar biosynthesis anti-sigma factor FlgM [Terriglobales bacterium]|jgi:flagellar biosynthesis anti-sigma factor FlgM
MRINPTAGGLEQPGSSNAGRAGQSKAAASQASAGGGAAGASTEANANADRTQFSLTPSRVQALAAQALGAPEVRASKVASLGQAIGSGGYSVDAARVADAITTELASFR